MKNLLLSSAFMLIGSFVFASNEVVVSDAVLSLSTDTKTELVVSEQSNDGDLTVYYCCAQGPETGNEYCSTGSTMMNACGRAAKLAFQAEG